MQSDGVLWLSDLCALLSGPARAVVDYALTCYGSNTKTPVSVEEGLVGWLAGWRHKKRGAREEVGPDELTNRYFQGSSLTS